MSKQHPLIIIIILLFSSILFTTTTTTTFEQQKCNVNVDGSCTDEEEEEEETKPCKNDYDECDFWQSHGECDANPNFMKVYCRKSCGECQVVDDVLEEEEEEDGMDEQPCKDEHEMCGSWSDDGECEANPAYMLTSCQLSCSVCTLRIKKDTDFGVKQTIPPSTSNTPLHEKTIQILNETKTYMTKVVSDPTYHEVRIMCRNHEASCSLRAAQNECQKPQTQIWMEGNCAPACQTCEKLGIAYKCPIDPEAKKALDVGDLNRMFERFLIEKDEFESRYGLNVLSRPLFDNETMDDATDFHVGPWVVTFDNFLQSDEIDALLQHGSDVGYHRSSDVGRKLENGHYDSKVSTDRTSHNTWCSEGCKTNPVVLNALRRMEYFTGIDRRHNEDLQLLRYEVGQYYVEHHDYIGHQRHRPCGVRVLTFFLYLNDVEEGGGTRFPLLDKENGGLTVMPKRGRALLWPSVLDEDPNGKDGRTNHEALKVEKGIKYGANAWIHMGDFQRAMEMGCHN